MFLSFFKRPAIYAPKFMACSNRITMGKMGNNVYMLFIHKNQLVPCLLIDSHSSHGAIRVLRSGTRTKGRPPNGGQPSVLLHNSIMSKAPGGKKEIEV